jgi:hypothetical protein
MSLGISSKTVSGVVLIIATVTLFNSSPPSLLSHLTHLIINVSDKLKDIFLGTRMNTDYQDIKSYKKPNICENL